MNRNALCIIGLKRKLTICLVLVLFCGLSFAANKTVSITSPNQQIKVDVNTTGQLSYRVFFKGKSITEANTLGMTLTNGTVLGNQCVLIKSITRTVNNEVKPLFGMASIYRDNYNELQLLFKGNYAVIFRVFNNGVAYRFVTTLPGKIQVKDEDVEYAFSTDVSAAMLKVKGFQNSYEEHYVNDKISYLDSGKIAGLPMLVQTGGVKVAITEADLLDYAGLYLTHTAKNKLKGVLPKFVLKDTIGGCCPGFEKLPVTRANYIAQTTGTRSFPWRLMIIAEQDRDLLYNNLVYLLASEDNIGDASWVKPGKVAWDWWSANNLTGVPFKTGFNTQTYQYFIDFAARNGIEYINMDEGWSDQFDLLKLNNGSIQIGTNAGGGLDIPYLFEYAKKKNVGIILWCVWHTLDRQMDQALSQFEKWGVKGLKVDFMDRDDQTVVNFYERLAKAAAKRKMIINYHGAFKPTGLERTYPNVINREAVQGLEQDKFSIKATPDHAVYIPFIRMLAGPMDYTPGGLYNANQKDFRISAERPMTQGTRCQQLAMYTLFYAPLEMLADAPTAYEKEPEILKYLSTMPTTWDETIPLDGKVGEFAVLARRKGMQWFIAGLTNWTGRPVNLKLDFLPEGTYQAELFTDGTNANRVGNDYVKSIKSNLNSRDSLTVNMADGGGFAIKLSKINN